MGASSHGGSFLVKVIGQLGGDPDDLKELRVLNRVLRWTDNGILLEADPRHQEILVAAESGHAVLTPSVKEQLTGKLAEAQLGATETTAFRSEAARCNYLGLDRPDVALAAKDCAAACRLRTEQADWPCSASRGT